MRNGSQFAEILCERSGFRSKEEVQMTEAQKILDPTRTGREAAGLLAALSKLIVGQDEAVRDCQRLSDAVGGDEPSRPPDWELPLPRSDGIRQNSYRRGDGRSPGQEPGSRHQNRPRRVPARTRDRQADRGASGLSHRSRRILRITKTLCALHSVEETSAPVVAGSTFGRRSDGRLPAKLDSHLEIPLTTVFMGGSRVPRS